jgi:hypothetical protein
LVFPVVSLSFWLSHQYPICIPLLPHSCSIPRPSHPSSLRYFLYLWMKTPLWREIKSFWTRQLATPPSLCESSEHLRLEGCAPRTCGTSVFIRTTPTSCLAFTDNPHDLISYPIIVKSVDAERLLVEAVRNSCHFCKLVVSLWFHWEGSAIFVLFQPQEKLHSDK